MYLEPDPQTQLRKEAMKRESVSESVQKGSQNSCAFCYGKYTPSWQPLAEELVE